MSFAPTDPELRATLETREAGELVSSLLAVDPMAGSVVDLANQRRVIRAVEIYQLTGETPSMRSEMAAAEDVRRYVPEIEFAAVGVDPGGDLESRIHARLAAMRDGGLIEEVRRLGDRLGRTARNAVGYREVQSAFRGEFTMDEAFSRAASSTKKLARRQRTWFQRDPRIRWIPWIEDPDERAKRVEETFA
jgi:tRNA dimethylallyltransferase